MNGGYIKPRGGYTEGEVFPYGVRFCCDAVYPQIDDSFTFNFLSNFDDISQITVNPL